MAVFVALAATLAATFASILESHRGVSCPGAWVMLVFRLRKLTFAKKGAPDGRARMYASRADHKP